jgi:histidine ammonia-lyase
VAVAAELRRLLEGSAHLRRRGDALARHTIQSGPQHLEHPVQEAYSLRCIPQVLGPVHEALAAARARVDIELNAVTDNPIVLREQRRFVHGGNFHGDYIATAMDQLKAAMVKLTMLSERRINGFLHPSLSRGLPPFLNLGRPGLTLGLQGLQFVATSTTAHSQTLAFPQAVHSIPTNGDNQDVVSLGTEAALIAARVVENAAVVLAIEAVVLAQAADALGVAGTLCPSSQALYGLVRTHLAAVRQDRVIHSELAALLIALREPAPAPSHAGDGAAAWEK